SRMDSHMDMEDTSAPLPIELATTLPIGEDNVEAITLPNEPCSHCMMHSQSTSNLSLRVAAQSSTCYQLLAVDGPTTVEMVVSPFPTFVELHDHGPPDSGAPLYVLVSSFRI